MLFNGCFLAGCNPHFGFPAGFKEFFVDTFVTHELFTTTVSYVVTRSLLPEYEDSNFEMSHFQIQVNHDLPRDVKKVISSCMLGG